MPLQTGRQCKLQMAHASHIQSKLGERATASPVAEDRTVELIEFHPMYWFLEALSGRNAAKWVAGY
jgi:hypothetical protein